MGPVRSSTMQLNSLQGELAALLPSRHWKIFKHTSNHCPSRYPFTLGSRECTNRRSGLPKDTAPQRGRRDPYQRPLGPKSRAVAKTPCMCTWSTSSDVGTLRVHGHCQEACPHEVLWRPTQCRWDSTAIYMVNRTARDTQSPVLKGEQKISTKLSRNGPRIRDRRRDRRGRCHCAMAPFYTILLTVRYSKDFLGCRIMFPVFPRSTSLRLWT